MLHNNVELKILIKNKPITEYHHRGLVFVEGREGSEYELEIHNRRNARVEVIVSVDGLSIIDGEPAGPQSTGYLVDAYQKVKIPGWMVDQTTAAKFQFGAKSKSYSTEMNDGSSVNNGVIGMIVYSEKVVPVSPFMFPMYYKGNPNDHYMKGITRGFNNNVGQSICSNSVSNSAFIGCSSASASQSQISQLTDVSLQNIGTEFGEATDFNTSKTTFERADMIGMSVIYYDDARGLKSRGIVIQKIKEQVQTTPDAFPAMRQGCKPPAKWSK